MDVHTSSRRDEIQDGHIYNFINYIYSLLENTKLTFSLDKKFSKEKIGRMDIIHSKDWASIIKNLRSGNIKEWDSFLDSVKDIDLKEDAPINQKSASLFEKINKIKEKFVKTA